MDIWGRRLHFADDIMRDGDYVSCDPDHHGAAATCCENNRDIHHFYRIEYERRIELTKRSVCRKDWEIFYMNIRGARQPHWRYVPSYLHTVGLTELYQKKSTTVGMLFSECCDVEWENGWWSRHGKSKCITKMWSISNAFTQYCFFYIAVSTSLNVQFLKIIPEISILMLTG